MENTLVRTPILGTNQFKTKFGIKVKRKFKLRLATKVKIAILLTLVTSLISNYLLLKKFMVYNCSVGGYFMTKEKCNELYENQFDSQELARQKFLETNADIMQ